MPNSFNDFRNIEPPVQRLNLEVICQLSITIGCNFIIEYAISVRVFDLLILFTFDLLVVRFSFFFFERLQTAPDFAVTGKPGCRLSKQGRIQPVGWGGGGQMVGSPA